MMQPGQYLRKLLRLVLCQSCCNYIFIYSIDSKQIIAINVYGYNYCSIYLFKFCRLRQDVYYLFVIREEILS
jgi:hypothetical protein